MLEGIIRPAIATSNNCGVTAYSPPPELEIWESSYEIADSLIGSMYDQISNEADIENSLRGIADPIHKSELKPILCSFLADPKTQCLTLTFQNDNQEFLTIGWLKA